MGKVGFKAFVSWQSHEYADQYKKHSQTKEEEKTNIIRGLQKQKFYKKINDVASFLLSPIGYLATNGKASQHIDYKTANVPGTNETARNTYKKETKRYVVINEKIRQQRLSVKNIKNSNNKIPVPSYAMHQNPLITALCIAYLAIFPISIVATVIGSVLRKVAIKNNHLVKKDFCIAKKHFTPMTYDLKKSRNKYEAPDHGTLIKNMYYKVPSNPLDRKIKYCFINTVFQEIDENKTADVLSIWSVFHPLDTKGISMYLKSYPHIVIIRGRFISESVVIKKNKTQESLIDKIANIGYKLKKMTFKDGKTSLIHQISINKLEDVKLYKPSFFDWLRGKKSIFILNSTETVE